jgi:integrase
VPESRRRRRPRGRGTVYARGPSTWRVRLRWTDPDSGAPREAERQVRGTRARAEEALDRLRADLAAGRLDGPSVAGERLTLNGWLDAWLDQRRLRVRAITQEHAERALRNYVRPTLGAVRLARLRPAHLQRLYGDLQAHRGLSPVTIRWVHAILRASLRAAVRLKLLPESPTEGVELPPLGDGERRPPSPEEVRRLLATSEAAADPYYPLWLLASRTGVRVGEACAVTWGDLDLPASGWGALTIREAKTPSGRRVVPLAPVVVAVLRRLPRRAPSAPVFVAPRGGELRENTVSPHLKKALTRAGLPRRLSWHVVFRHFAATTMVAETHDLAAAARGLGHSEKAKLAVTLGTYVHADEGAVRRAYRALDDAVAGAVGGTAGGDGALRGVAYQELRRLNARLRSGVAAPGGEAPDQGGRAPQGGGTWTGEAPPLSRTGPGSDDVARSGGFGPRDHPGAVPRLGRVQGVRSRAARGRGPTPPAARSRPPGRRRGGGRGRRASTTGP